MTYKDYGGVNSTLSSGTRLLIGWPEKAFASLVAVSHFDIEEGCKNAGLWRSVYLLTSVGEWWPCASYIVCECPP